MVNGDTYRIMITEMVFKRLTRDLTEANAPITSDYLVQLVQKKHNSHKGNATITVNGDTYRIMKTEMVFKNNSMAQLATRLIPQSIYCVKRPLN